MHWPSAQGWVCPGEGHGSRFHLGRVPGCREVWGAGSPTSDLTGRTRGGQDSREPGDLCSGCCGARQGKGACEKPSPWCWASPAPRSGLLLLLEGERVPSRDHLSPSVPSAGPVSAVGCCCSTCPRAGMEGTRWQGHTQPPAAIPTLPAPPFPWCKPRALHPRSGAPGCRHPGEGVPNS